jgi:hypothetical protein
VRPPPRSDGTDWLGLSCRQGCSNHRPRGRWYLDGIGLPAPTPTGLWPPTATPNEVCSWPQQAQNHLGTSIISLILTNRESHHLHLSLSEFRRPGRVFVGTSTRAETT